MNMSSTGPETPRSRALFFLGKVERVEQGMGAAFINIGEERNAFLRKEAIPWCEGKVGSALTVGQMISVQVIKEPLGTKGAQVSADITFPGLYVVYRPYGYRKIAVSKKLGIEMRAEFESIFESELTESEGVIVRTAAAEVEKSVVLDEWKLLKQRYLSLEKMKSNKPGLLWKEPLLPDQLIRKFPVTSIRQILIDDAVLAARLKERYPTLAVAIHWEKKLSHHLPVSISKLQEEMVEPVVEGNGGVQLVIEQTEAMTVIDVNSHRMKENAFTNSQALEANLLAAEEVQRQIRLRNLSGIIIVDFISMKDPNKEKRLVTEMARLLKNDPIKTNVYGMTKLGLMELTRKREWKRPHDLLAKKRKSAFNIDTMVYRLERELIDDTKAETVLIAVSPAFYERKKRLLSESVSSKIPQELFVRQDEDIHGYQIELEGSIDMIREAIQRRGYNVDNLF